MPRFIRFVMGGFIIIMLLFFIFTSIGYYWLNRSLPEVRGERILSGIADTVTVYRDGYAIPHIHAGNAEDVWFAQGYITAQDRFFQMDYWRHLSMADLTGMLGESARPADSLIQQLQINAMVKNARDQMSDENWRIYAAYSRGINAYLETYKKRLPVEYRLLNFQPAPWKPEDCIRLWFGFSVLMDAGGWEKNIIRKLKDELGIETLQRLLPNLPLNDLGKSSDSFFRLLTKVKRSQYIPWFNNRGHVWAAADTAGTNGNRLLAFTLPGVYRMPCLYYESALYTPEFGARGLSIPGFPGFLSGFNGVIAWAGAGDDRESAFMTPDNAGPAKEPGSVFFHLIQCRDAQDGLNRLNSLHRPAMHWICMDSSGHIYGQTPLRAGTKKSETFLIRHWIDRRIHALKLENTPPSLAGFQKMQADTRSVLADSLLPVLVPLLAGEPEFKIWAERLKKWDHEMRIGDAEALVFEIWIRKMNSAIFEKDLGKPFYSHFLSAPLLWQSMLSRYLLNHSRRTEPGEEPMPSLISRTFRQALREIREEYGDNEQKWSWGNAHQFSYSHWLISHESLQLSRAFGMQQPLLLGPYALDGCFASVTGNSVFNKDSAALCGPAVRMIIDLGHPDNTLSILSTGQAGQMIDNHYQDQVPLFTKGYYHPTLFDPVKIKQSGWLRFCLYPEPGE